MNTSPRCPKHKFSAKMSQVSEVQPLGIFLLDPASNHGESYFFRKLVYQTHNLDLIKVASILNAYAPTRDQSKGEKCKVCMHGDQGDINKLWSLNYNSEVLEIITYLQPLWNAAFTVAGRPPRKSAWAVSHRSALVSIATPHTAKSSWPSRKKIIWKFFLKKDIYTYEFKVHALWWVEPAGKPRECQAEVPSSARWERRQGCLTALNPVLI